MIDQSPEAWASAAAISGGQLPAQGPLHALLPPASLSNAYSVSPAVLVIIPPIFLAGACAKPVPAIASPTINTAIPFRIIIPISLIDQSNAAFLTSLQTPVDLIIFRLERETSHVGGGRRPTRWIAIIMLARKRSTARTS